MIPFSALCSLHTLLHYIFVSLRLRTLLILSDGKIGSTECDELVKLLHYSDWKLLTDVAFLLRSDIAAELIIQVSQSLDETDDLR